MKIELNSTDILNLMDRPAFWVSDGVVREVNHGASARFITPGTAIASMLLSGQEDYAQFTSGCLCLTLSVGGRSCPASVTRMGGADLFSLDHEDEDAGLRALSLAARELRQPLSQVLTVSDQLLPTLAEDQPGSSRQIARLNRSLHQLLRLVGNMSDACPSTAPRMELRDITAVVREIVEHAAPLCLSAGVELISEDHPAAVYTLLDAQWLERAIYNLLSNALKHTSPGGTIAVALKCRGKTILLSVEDSGNGTPVSFAPGTLSRFLREPALDDGLSGLGLGLPLIRAAASAHSGTLLLEQGKHGGLKATLSLPVRHGDGTTLRSPVAHLDYAGERDHGLIELSEVLPADFFHPKHI